MSNMSEQRKALIALAQQFHEDAARFEKESQTGFRGNFQENYARAQLCKTHAKQLEEILDGKAVPC